MKILMAQDTFLPRLGGAEVHVWKLSKELRARGYRITFVTATPGPLLVDGFRVYRLAHLQSQGKRAVATLPFYLPQLMSLVKNCEIVHGHYTAFCSAVLGMLAWSLRRPFVVTLHGYGTLDSSVLGNFWSQRWRFLAFRTADKVIATSGEMAEVARRFVPRERIVIVPNGVDTIGFAPSADALPPFPVRVATVRRLVPKNGVQYLIEAVPFILQRVPRPTEFWIVGDGPLRQYLETRVRELGVEKAVRFFGAVPNEHVPEIFKQTHVVVFPSSAESTSIAALEAMAMAKPVVASAVGGYPELLGANERGLLVKLFDHCQSNYDAPLSLPPEPVQALANAVIRLIAEPELARALGVKARAHVQRYYDWRLIAEKVERVYTDVMRK